MISSACPQCAGAVSLWARMCGRCGAPNPARHRMLAIVTAIVVLIPLCIGATLVATREQHPGAAETTVAPPPAAPTVATTGGDFAWLTAAMTACDKTASQQPDKVHFLVIPLQADRKDMPDWQLIATGAIGNGITLPADDALGGLRRGTLKIYADEYVFNMQDAETRAIYKWNPSTGANSFSTPEAEMVRSFKVRIQPQNKAENDDWGPVYQRQRGGCHWVAAIVRN
jgi:hypothetical protein